VSKLAAHIEIKLLNEGCTEYPWFTNFCIHMQKKEQITAGGSCNQGMTEWLIQISCFARTRHGSISAVM
jgi:hypothetical protein